MEATWSLLEGAEAGSLGSWTAETKESSLSSGPEASTVPLGGNGAPYDGEGQLAKGTAYSFPRGQPQLQS